MSIEESTFKGIKHYFNTDETNEVIRKKKITVEKKNLGYLEKYNLVISNEQIFDKFNTIDQISKGSFGKVYRVQFKKEIGLDGKFAMKRVPLIGNKEKDEKIMIEVLANYELKGNKNIVQITDYIIYIDDFKDIFLNIFMEYCELSLSDWFQENNELEDREYEESIGMFLGIAEGLKYIHEMGFVHRDLKPSNIMVGDKLVC